MLPWWVFARSGSEEERRAADTISKVFIWTIPVVSSPFVFVASLAGIDGVLPLSVVLVPAGALRMWIGVRICYWRWPEMMKAAADAANRGREERRNQARRKRR
jgi:hypothetical protein